jgi:MurNAc alpha-1-phosphate uridylyltransferase
MQCIVLAGGLGRRMLPQTEELPKSLLPVAGRPFVDWQLAWLAAEGVEHVVMSIGYRGDMIQRHLGDGSRFALRISYAHDGDVPLGTGGALRLVVDQNLADPHFFLLYGDSYLPVSLSDIETSYFMQAAPVLMTVYRDREGLEHPNVVFDGTMVRRYQKGLEHPPADMQYVDYGVSVWQRQIVRSLVPEGAAADLANLYMALSESGQLAGFEARERFYEIGSSRGLSDLESRLRSGGALGTPLDAGR